MLIIDKDNKPHQHPPAHKAQELIAEGGRVVDQAEFEALQVEMNTPSPPTDEELATEFRKQRDIYIKKLEDLLRQYEREEKLKARGKKASTKHTKQEYDEIADLIEDMCAIPEQSGFPQTITWPEIPEFLNQYM